VTRHLFDDLGYPVALNEPARRVVSLVPSLTEALAATVPERLVGATDWCTHPSDLDVIRVRGTKNPDRKAITALAPDLVVANQEENRRLDVDRLRASGVPVWVTVIESVDQALRSMRRLFVDVLDVGAPEWLREAADEWRLGQLRARSFGWPCRSGVIRGWSSVRAPSLETCSRASAWRTSMARASSAIRTWSLSSCRPWAPTWCCCPTSPTSSAAMTALRRSLAYAQFSCLVVI
jgi:hypothetical protein